MGGHVFHAFVNAWDDRSFIGNGGKFDRSVDGFFVANARGYNREFENDSYLMNPMFHEFFQNKDRHWQGVDKPKVSLSRKDKQAIKMQCHPQQTVYLTRPSAPWNRFGDSGKF